MFRRSGRAAPITTLAVGGLLFIACVSGESLDPGGDGNAGATSGAAGSGTGSGGAAPSGGSTQGGAGGQPGNGGSTSGTDAGGTATGGAFPTGGTATGGAFPTGGTATGGAFPTGGTATGGTATGGTATGGSAGRGGTATGGTATGGTATGGTSTGGTMATGGTGGTVAPPPNINGGQMAWASRYWDCCKPACGWSGNTGGRTPMKSCNMQNQPLSSNDTRNACESGGSAFMCWNGAPWSVGGQLSYGFVAASGPNYVCGRCFHIQFNGTGHNGTNPGVTAINGKHMIVQVINNGGVAQDQMDLLIPGGGVGALNACDDQWGSGTDLGAQYGGWRATCGSNADCIRGKCQAAFSNKPELMAGCEWFIGWFAMADNPNFVYERIACPSAITQRSGLSDPG